jgi:hypothetical protein
MESRQALADIAILDTADRVGRATHLWLRRHDTPPDSAFRAQCLAAGFIAELCEALDLSRRHAIFAAYSYALLDDEAADPLRIAELLLNCHSGHDTTAQFEQGRAMACTMLAMIESGGGEFVAATADTSSFRRTC